MKVKKTLLGLSTVLVAVLFGLSYSEEEPYKIVKRPGKNPLKCFKKEFTTQCVEMEPDEVDKDAGKLDDTHDVEKGPLGGKIYRIGDSTMECFPNGQCFEVNMSLLTTLAPIQVATPTRIVKRPGKNPLKCFNEGGKSKCVEMKPEEVEAGGGPLDDPHDVETGPLGGKIYKIGGSTMECFPNGQCFEVNTLLLTTPAPEATIVKRPGENPLKCFDHGGVSKCVEIEPEEAETDDGKLDDTHDVEKGPLGGKIYKMGGTMMECFSNGQCFEVKPKPITTPEPTDSTQRPAGKLYRKGNEIVECFGNGKCGVVEFVTFDTGKNCWVHEENGNNNNGNGDDGHDDPNEDFENYDGKEGVENDWGNADNEIDGTNGDSGNYEADGDIGIFDADEDSGNDDANGDSENNDENGDSGNVDENGEEVDFGYWDYIEVDYDEEEEGSEDSDTNQYEGEIQAQGMGTKVPGKAECTFQNSAAVSGSITLVEESADSPIQMIGKISGLKEGIHVLTFHQNGDVQTKGCKGVGGYHRPTTQKLHKRFPRQALLNLPFVERNAYGNCLKHVAACKARRTSSYKCETNLNRCVKILKCKRCKEKAGSSGIAPGVTFETIGDLEKGGHFTYKSEVPRNSLFVYAEKNGESTFDEMEREQSLRGADSVLGKSIVLSILPKDPAGDFKGIACCKIEPGGSTIIM